jgi:hypothetical protein
MWRAFDAIAVRNQNRSRPFPGLWLPDDGTKGHCQADPSKGHAGSMRLCGTVNTVRGLTFLLSEIAKAPICFRPYLYRARNLVERFFNRIKQCRPIATGMTNSTRTTLLSLSSQPFGFGFGFAPWNYKP